MPQNYLVEYESAPTVYTALTNVQSINYRWGRRKITDQWTPNTGEIVFRAPNYFATPIPQLVPGCTIRVKTASNIVLFYGFISDVRAEYGIPYQSSVGPADFVSISFESAFALWGRQQGLNYSISAGLASSQLSTAAAQADLPLGHDFTGAADMQVGASTVSGTWGEWISKWLLTTGGRLLDIYQNINLNQKGAIVDAPNFSDTVNDGLNKCYEKLEFSSMADNFYTEVEVDPDGFAATVVQSGSGPYRSLKLQTYSASQSAGADLANYYLASLSASQIQPTAVTMLAEAQAVQNIDFNFVGYTWSKSTLTFRGTSRTVLTIGGVFSATPEATRVTCYLSGFENNNFLLLNDSVFGKLDENRLGF